MVYKYVQKPSYNSIFEFKFVFLICPKNKTALSSCNAYRWFLKIKNSFLPSFNLHVK